MVRRDPMYVPRPRQGTSRDDREDVVGPGVAAPGPPRRPRATSRARSPSACIVARVSGGPDPRTIGSGRTGGTNALRALGRKWAALVVAGDLAKGARSRARSPGSRRAATRSPRSSSRRRPSPARSARSSCNFSGGRGVGTGVGTMLVIQPLAVVLAAPVFFLAILATRYVSLGSLLGSAAMFPATLLIWAVASGWVPPAYLVWAAVGPVLIWLAHADNIDRLLHGTGAQVRPRADHRRLAPRRRRELPSPYDEAPQSSWVTAVRFIVTRTAWLRAARETPSDRSGWPVRPEAVDR